MFLNVKGKYGMFEMPFCLVHPNTIVPQYLSEHYVY